MCSLDTATARISCLVNGDWLALGRAQKFRVVQPDGRITPGRGGGGGDEHRRQRVKLPPGQLLRRASGELLLRVGEVFPHPNLAPSPSLPGKGRRRPLTGRLVGAAQHKDLSGLAQGAGDLPFPAMDADNCHIVPGSFQLGAEILQRADSRNQLERNLLHLPQRAAQLFCPAVKADVAGEQHRDKASLRLAVDQAGNLLILKGSCPLRLRSANFLHCLQHPFGADQAVASFNDLSGPPPSADRDCPSRFQSNIPAASGSPAFLFKT